MQIFISCGHNNARKSLVSLTKDIWAVYDGISEYSVVKDVSRLISARYMGKNTLVFVPEWLNLSQRVKWVNERSRDGDFAIELHMNAWGGKGTEVFYFAWSKFMQEKAYSFSQSISWTLGIMNRWTKEDTKTRFGRLGWIRDTKPMALLIELGFLDSKDDRKKVQEYWPTAMARALQEILW